MAALREAVYRPQAFRAFPILRRFAPALIPRPDYLKREKKGIGIGGGIPNSDTIQLMSNYLYDDYGVLVFAGASPEEVQQIGDGLKATKREGLGGERWRHRHSKQSDSKIQYGKFTTYRFRTEDSQIEKEPMSENALFTPEALLSMGRKAAKMWVDETFQKLRQEQTFETLSSREANFMVNQRDQALYGVLHQTINGPRLPSLNAHVCSRKILGGFELCIGFYTVGTERYAGRVLLHVMPHNSSDDPEGQIQGKHIPLLYANAPGHQAGDELLTKVVLRLLQLEQEIWASPAKMEELRPTLSREEIIRQRKGSVLRDLSGIVKARERNEKALEKDPSWIVNLRKRREKALRIELSSIEKMEDDEAEDGKVTNSTRRSGTARGGHWKWLGKK